jgi:manganese oxidase
MPLPDNTLPMMTGFGQYGPLEMGGMFSVVKVREGLARDDYGDPGPYRHPEGTVAYEYKGPLVEPARRSESSPTARPAIEVTVIKPGSKAMSISDH